ncbi:MAG TPA: HAD-IIA family hydrolase [Anaerolineales bacterium]|nr:HAD-IIA family hydrolase [Anaerolineales bacterium]
MIKPKALILDMDGVLWRGDLWLIEPAALFDRLEAAGIRVGLATNNATRTPDYYIEKFSQQGVTLNRRQIVNSGIAAARYLAERFPASGSILVVGEWGLAETLAGHGFTLNGTDPLAVVCGLDREITYDKIKRASMAVRAGALFIGTNPDKTFPTPEGLVPGAGSILAAITAASDAEPLITGKPQPAMYQILLQELETQVSETLVVGDRLETDIAGGRTLGCPSALVLSGVSTAAEAAASPHRPDHIFPDLNAVVEAILS